MAGPVTTGVGDPLSLGISVSAPMTGNPHSGFERVRALWMKHRGPGNVTFSPTDQMSIPDGMEVLTRGTFSEPGDYVLRVQAYRPTRVAVRGAPNAAGPTHTPTLQSRPRSH